VTRLHRERWSAATPTFTSQANGQRGAQVTVQGAPLGPEEKIIHHSQLLKSMARAVLLVTAAMTWPG
jgi:hypothetical protein